MAKLQRFRRRDPVASEPVDQTLTDVPADEPADEPVEQDVPDDVLDEAIAEPDGAPDPATRRTTARLRLSVLDSTPVGLLMAAHPKQVLVTGAGLGVAALAAGRPVREAAVVAATATVGQAILGWHNDIVDRERDLRHHTPRKPVAEGRLEVGTAWYAVALGVLLVIPLSISTGVDAGTFYLAALAVGLLGNVVLRRGLLSWVPWAAQLALFVPYLSYGGWGGDADGSPPEPVMVVLFALLGVGVHFLRAIWGLVADDADGWTYLPLRLGRKLGATRLLVLSASYTFVVLAVIIIVGGTVGLRR